MKTESPRWKTSSRCSGGNCVAVAARRGNEPMPIPPGPTTHEQHQERTDQP